jgi:hypothetical protein
VQANALQNQLLQFMLGMTDALKAANSPSYECLGDVSNALTNAIDGFQEVVDLVGLSAKMQTPDDEVWVNKVLAVHLEASPRQIAHSRDALSFAAGKCRQDNIVNAKVRQALDIFSRLDGFCTTLQGKLGAMQR